MFVPMIIIDIYNIIMHRFDRCGSIQSAAMYRKANDPSSVLVHYDHDPVGVQKDGLASKQIYAPEAVFCVSKHGQP